ncbi:hypothetical protein [Hymenobacter volaticus]|uniref:Uncharacterized protein n=1 Tax=Hymenobacter volaticus TaxID=2932254 RepID=A0ABY4GAP1_9BACT|nr:hypothetical protein [Hymenobacter volaticus]UOQ67980.1 hypothetical protein MUN86_09040 [Hymenobacter volaticus]
MIRTLSYGLLLAFSLLTAQGYAADIWVSPKGSDRAAGTALQPLATVAAALRQARNLRRLNDPSVQTGVHIWVRGASTDCTSRCFCGPKMPVL